MVEVAQHLHSATKSILRSGQCKAATEVGKISFCFNAGMYWMG